MSFAGKPPFSPVHVLVFHQVGNLGLLFMLLFFIYAALGVELFGELGESSKSPNEPLMRFSSWN